MSNQVVRFNRGTNVGIPKAILDQLPSAPIHVEYSPHACERALEHGFAEVVQVIDLKSPKVQVVEVECERRPGSNALVPVHFVARVKTGGVNDFVTAITKKVVVPKLVGERAHLWVGKTVWANRWFDNHTTLKADRVVCL